MIFTNIVNAAPLDFAADSTRWAAYRDSLGRSARKVRCDGDDGAKYDAWELPDGAIVGACRRVLSAAQLTAATAAAAAAVASDTRLANNRARLDVLANRAARYAKDPVANAADQLTNRLMHEFLARLWLAERTDDV